MTQHSTKASGCLEKTHEGMDVDDTTYIEADLNGANTSGML